MRVVWGEMGKRAMMRAGAGSVLSAGVGAYAGGSDMADEGVGVYASDGRYCSVVRGRRIRAMSGHRGAVAVA